MVNGMFKIGLLSSLLVPLRALIPGLGRTITQAAAKRAIPAGASKFLGVAGKTLANPLDLGLNTYFAAAEARPPRGIRIYQ